MSEAPPDPGPEEELDIGPYGPRGRDTPPLVNMLGGYGIIFAACVIVPLVVLAIIRFVIL